MKPLDPDQGKLAILAGLILPAERIISTLLRRGKLARSNEALAAAIGAQAAALEAHRKDLVDHRKELRDSLDGVYRRLGRAEGRLEALTGVSSSTPSPLPPEPLTDQGTKAT